MLGAFLLAGLIAAPLSSLAMFLPVQRRWTAAGGWAYTRRFVLAIAATAASCAASYAISVWAGTTSFRALVAAATLAAFSLLTLPVTRRWNGRAHACWTSCTYLYVAYLVFIIHWTFVSNLGVGGTIGGTVLWLLEAVAGLFAGAYLWELCDALGTEHWRRRVVQPRAVVPPTAHQPFVSLHVPAHNEPPEMVIETLTQLIHLDYPHYEIVAIDDNTDDPQLWQPVQEWCREHGVKFAHLDNWPGYKSGALNYALSHLIDPRAEIVGVVDSDYQIEPNFLAECAPLFVDPSVGFIQAPQDYREWEGSGYFRRLYYSYKYFFAVSQPSRNERDAAIFAGTMGLIRRAALERLGGWDEWCITEDAELSLRLLRAGWSGLHVDQSFGHGVMPLTFEALKGQRYRWCFGGIQILRRYWRSLLPGRTSERNQLSLGQRWGYLSGGLQWYGDLLGVLFYLFLLAGAANLAAGGGQLFRKLTGFLVAAVPVLVVLGLVRAVALLRRGTGASWRDAIGAFFIWQATSLVVARASVQGLFAREAVFMRTPKTFDRAGVWQVIRANWGESLLATLGGLGIVAGIVNYGTLSGPLLAVLLLAPTLGFAAAPYNSLAAQRAALPPELTQRRRTEFLRQPRVVGGALAAGGLLAVGGAAAVVVALLLSPAAGRLHGPSIVAPKHGSSHSGAHSPGGSATGSAPGVPGSSGPVSNGVTGGPVSSSVPSSSAAPSGSSPGSSAGSSSSVPSSSPSSSVSSPSRTRSSSSTGTTSPAAVTSSVGSSVAP